MAKQQSAQTGVVVPDAAKGSQLVSNLMIEGPSYLAKAHALQVRNAEEHKAALELLGQIANRKKLCEDERLKITGPLHKAWQATNTFFASLLNPFAQVDTIARNKVLVYEKAERDKAAAAQKLLDDAAQRERDKVAAQAKEAERVAAEKAKALKDEAYRKKAEADAAATRAQQAAASGDTAGAAAAQAEFTTATKAAAKLETRAETVSTAAAAKVETLEMRGRSIVAPIVQAPDLKAAGKSDRRVWKWKVLDESKIDRRYLCVDETKINGLVKSMKKEAAELVGEGAIEVWDEPDLSIRAKP